MSTASENQPRGTSGGYGQRELPSVAELLNPRNLFQFIWGFISTWFVSRRFNQLGLGLPFIIFVVVLGMATWTSLSTTTAERSLKYERAAYLADRDGKQEEADLYLTQLTRLQPDDDRVRMQLMLHLIEQDKLDEAAVHLRALTPTDEEGYHHARLWLVDQASRENPKFPLTSDQKLAQLQQAIKEDPHNPNTHRLLAATYIDRNELRIAEQHLLNAVDQHPSLGLLLYQLQGSLDRRTPESLEHLRKSVSDLQQRAKDEPDNLDVRIYWAQALALLGNKLEAEAVLQEGIRTASDPEKMRSALAGLYLSDARQKVEQSPLNANIAAASVVQAIAIDPLNATAIQMAVTLAGSGATFTVENLKPAIDLLQQRIREEDAQLDDRITLAQLLAVAGQHQPAIDLLRPHIDENSSVETLLIRLYHVQGEEDKAREIADRILTRTKQQLDENPDNLQAFMAYIQALGIGRRHAEAVQLIDERLNEEGSDRSQLAPPIKRIYVGQCLAAFDTAHREGNGNDAFHYLEQAIDTRSVDYSFLARLSQLSTSEGELAEKADRMITSLLAQGTNNAQIYQLVGTQALAAEQHKRAVKYLDRAHSMLPDDPAVANNYAVALIRASRDNSEQALSLCNAALEKLPNHPDVLSTRAEINIARSRWDIARNDLELALPHRPKSATLRRLLVKVFTELGDDDLAAEHQKVLDQLEAEKPDSGA